MAKSEKDVIIDISELPSNSHKSKQQATEEPKEKQVRKVVTGKVVRQKKTLGRKFSEILIGDESRSVADYIVHEVLITAAKNMICDMVGWGGAAEMILFGDKRGGRGGSRSKSGSRVSYGSFYRDGDGRGGREKDRRDLSRTSRARHDFDDIIIETRGEAEEVRDQLIDMCIDFGLVSVADFYSMVDVTSTYADNKWGWDDMRGLDIIRARGGRGYIINLPKPKPLEI